MTYHDSGMMGFASLYPSYMGWKLEEELRSLLPWLWEKLTVDGQGAWRVEWLVEE
ncbi:class I SAM-dependent methyltransferase [Methylocaldum gracile]|jgi:23S rRNA A2030 N6-methylase RlmJ|nr:23S rRNA (adenine(2030)-N(6))-methyltransferase RlmJ [Methylocaldum sp. BRCS4]